MAHADETYSPECQHPVLITVIARAGNHAREELNNESWKGLKKLI